MEIDHEKLDAAALAIMGLTLHDNGRVWKQVDWDIMNRLHEKGLISDPVGKTKSVLLTEKGEKEAKRMLKELFSKS